MDNTSLVMTVEGLRAVAAVCSEIITNNSKNSNNNGSSTNSNSTNDSSSGMNNGANDTNNSLNATNTSNDRSTLLIAADIEQSCLQVLGMTTNNNNSNDSNSGSSNGTNKDGKDGRTGGLASLISFRSNTLGSLLSTTKENNYDASENNSTTINTSSNSSIIQRTNSAIQRSATAPVISNGISTDSNNSSLITTTSLSNNTTNNNISSGSTTTIDPVGGTPSPINSLLANDFTFSQGITNAHITPITDIIVLHEDDPMPAGFIKISRSITGIYPADLNAASGSRQLWLAVARFPTAPAITGLILGSVDQGEFIPPGFTPVKRYATGRVADLHYGGTNGPQLILCFCRSMGSPIIDIGIAFPSGAIALTTLLAKGKGNSNVITIDNNITTTLHTNTRTVLGGTAANLVIAQEEARKSTGVFGGLGQITMEIGRAVAKLGTPREDIPPTYSILKHTILGMDVNLTGGSAKGNAVLVYVKDLTHIDALEDYSGSPLKMCNINVIQTTGTNGKEDSTTNGSNTKVSLVPEENDQSQVNLPLSPEGKYTNNFSSSNNNNTSTTSFTSGPVRLLPSLPASSISTDVAVQAVQSRLDQLTNNSSSNPLVPLSIARQRAAIVAQQKAKEEEKMKKNGSTARRNSLSLVREVSDGTDSSTGNTTTDTKDTEDNKDKDGNDPSAVPSRSSTNGSKMLGKLSGAVGKLFGRKGETNTTNNNKDSTGNNAKDSNVDPTVGGTTVDGNNANDTSLSMVIGVAAENDTSLNTSLSNALNNSGPVSAISSSSTGSNGGGGFLSPNGRMFGFARSRSFLKEKSGTNLSLANALSSTANSKNNNNHTGTINDINTLNNITGINSSSSTNGGMTNTSLLSLGFDHHHNNNSTNLRIRSGTDVIESADLDQIEGNGINTDGNNEQVNNYRDRFQRNYASPDDSSNNARETLDEEDPNGDVSSETLNFSKTKDDNGSNTNNNNNDDDDDDQEYGISDNEEIIEHEENDEEKAQHSRMRSHNRSSRTRHYHHRTTSAANAMLDEYGSDTEINPNVSSANHSGSAAHLHHHRHQHHSSSAPSDGTQPNSSSSSSVAGTVTTLRQGMQVPEPSTSPTHGLGLNLALVTKTHGNSSGTGTPTNSSRPDTPANNDLTSSAFTSLSARSRARSSSSVIGGNSREGGGRGSIVALPPRLASKHLLNDTEDLPKAKNSGTNSKFIGIKDTAVNNNGNGSNGSGKNTTNTFVTMEHGHEAPVPSRTTDAATNKSEQGQDSARRFVLFRHMAWMQSPAASRMCIESARAAAKTSDSGTGEELNPMMSSLNSSTDALSSFLIPSAASTLIVPLLRALYCRLPEIVATALDALALIVKTGFFMRPVTNCTTHLSLDSDLDPLQEASLITAAGWNLLDTVVACAVDATLPLLEYVSEPLMGFLHEVVVCSSGGYLSAQINDGTLMPSGAHVSPSTNNKTGFTLLSTIKTPIVPVGLHPATLHRILNAALSAHTFAHQKCVYSERGWQIFMRAGKDRDAEGFEARYRDGRRQAACILYALKSTVFTLMNSLEFDGRTNIDISVPNAILTWAYPNGIPKNITKALGNGTNSNGFKLSLAGLWTSNGSSGGSTGTATAAPVSNSSLFGGRRENTAETYYGIRRSYASDYSYLSRAYSAHSTGSASLCSEMHVAAAPHIIHRPFPALADDLSSLVICPYDALSIPNRSTTNDIVVLITLLSKIALEPVSFGDLRSSIDSYSANGGNTAKRLSALLLRDTALVLLQDVFTGAGPVFAASPLLTGSITRFVCPTILSHAMSPRIFHPCLSVSFGAGGAFGNNYNTIGSGGGGSIDACEAWFAAMGNEIGSLISSTFTYVHCGSLDDKYSKMFDDMLKNSGNNGSRNGSGTNGTSSVIYNDDSIDSLGLAIVPSLSALRAILRIVGAMWTSKGSDDEMMMGSSSSSSSSTSMPVSNEDDTFILNNNTSTMVTCASIREACAREITALSRAILLSTLACPTAPPFLRLDALDELMTWVTAPQLLMELYINHDMYPSAACPYPHMRFLRTSIATIVTLACSRRRPVNLAAILQGSTNDPLSLLLSEQILMETFAESQEPPRPDLLPANTSIATRAYALNAYSRSELCKQAATFFTSIVRALMDSAATVQMSTTTGTVHSSGSHSTKSSNDSVIVHGTLDDEEKDSRVAWHPTSPTHPSLMRNSGGNSTKGYSLSMGLTIVPPTPGHPKKYGSSGGFSFDTPLKHKGSFTSSSSNPLDTGTNLNGSSVRAMHDAQRAAEITLYSAMAIAQEKGVKKGLVPLLAAGYVHNSGSGISHFLRLCGQEFALDSEIGDYIGDEGRTPEDIVLMKSTRTELFGGISFAGMAFDVALRIMLTKAGFRLPGEAQKIDRLTQAFAYAYFDDNRPNETLLNEGQQGGNNKDTTDNTEKSTKKESTNTSPPTTTNPTVIHSVATPDGRLYPASPDVVEILSFSAIMLNTDAHNANIKKEKKMTRKQFVSNNRGIDKGADLPKAFLEYLYDSIVSNEIKMRTNTPSAVPANNTGVSSGNNNNVSTGNTNTGNVTNGNNSIIENIPLTCTTHGPLPPEVFAKVTGALPSVGTVPVNPNVLTTLMINNTNNNVTSVLTNLVQNNASLNLTVAEGDLETNTDTVFYAGTLSTEASRWGHHLSACAKADDRRGAVEYSTSPNAANTSQAAPIFFPVPYKRTFSITTVTCAVEDIWPHVMAFATALLKLQSIPTTTTGNTLGSNASGNDTGNGTKDSTNSTDSKTGTNTATPPIPLPPSGTSSSGGGLKSFMGGLGLNKKTSFLNRTSSIATKEDTSTASTPNVLVQSKDKDGTTTHSSMSSVSTTGSNSTTNSSATASVSALPPHGLYIAKLNTASPNDIDRRLAALDTLKYATSAAIFLGRSKLAIEGANALLQVEAALLGIDKALSNRDSKDGNESWYCAIMDLTKKTVPHDTTNTSFITDPGEVAIAISLLHIAVAEMREAATAAAEAATLQNTAARFKGELSSMMALSNSSSTSSRRLLYEGEMTKVASGGKGKHTLYRFFLFTDMLVYAQRGTFSDKYAAHQTIPLTRIRVEPDPPELVTGYSGSQNLPYGVSFRLDTTIKPLYLYCATETEATDWKRHIREAVAELHWAMEAGEFSQQQQQNSVSSNTIGRAADAGTAFLAAAAAAIAQGKDPATVAAQAVVTSNTGTTSTSTLSSSNITKSLAMITGSNSGNSSPQKGVKATVPDQQSVNPPLPGSSYSHGSTEGTLNKEEGRNTENRNKGDSTLNTSIRSSIDPPSDTGTTGTDNVATNPTPYDNLSELKQAFLLAVSFCRPLLSTETGTPGTGSVPMGSRVDLGITSPSSTSSLHDNDKLQFYGLFKQATIGDCPVPSSIDDISMMLSNGNSSPTDSTVIAITRAKRDAWLSYKGLRRREAMRKFVELLDKKVPRWNSTTTATGSNDK